MLNLIAESKNKEKSEDEYIDMELDRKAERDHENAIEQIDGTVGAGKAARRKIRSKQGREHMDQTTTSAGKRDADAAGADAPPPPKVPPVIPEKFDLAANDDAKIEPPKIEVPK